MLPIEIWEPYRLMAQNDSTVLVLPCQSELTIHYQVTDIRVHNNTYVLI